MDGHRSTERPHQKAALLQRSNCAAMSFSSVNSLPANVWEMLQLKHFTIFNFLYPAQFFKELKTTPCQTFQSMD